MLFLKYMMLMGGVGMFLVSALVVTDELRSGLRSRCSSEVISGRALCRTGVAFLCLAWAPILIAMSLLLRG